MRVMMLGLYALSAGCAEKDKIAGSDDTGTPGLPQSSCPDDVPEAYKYLWDCEAETCDGERARYHYGEGSSTGSGDLSATERWFWFWNDDDGVLSSCTDTFTITGESGTVDSSDDPCAGCELSWAVTWELTEDNCSIDYERTFNNRDLDEQIYDGYLLFDTHKTLGDERNDNDAMLVVALFNESGTSTYAQSINYARGTATPTSSADAPPEDYVWANTGADCVTIR